MIDGYSEQPIEDALVAVDGKRIVYAGKADNYRGSREGEWYKLEQETVMPGMIDCHAHLSGEESQNLTGKSAYDCLLTIAHDCGELVDAGITGVRDMSAFGPSLERAIEKGLFRGPRIMPGGRVISVTAGHADIGPEIPVEEINRRDLTSYIADGKDGCLKAVRQQFREGARFIKICATGGVSSSVDNPNDIQFSEEEMEVMVAEAKRRNSYVAAHCTGLAGTLQAIRAGVHSVEHGVNLNEECVRLMKEKDITLVSTCYVPFMITKMTGHSEEMVKKGNDCVDTILSGYRLAHEAGVRLAMGTDFSNSRNTPYREIGKELTYICKCGFSPMEAITAATKNGAYLMDMADQTGTLESGKLADLLIVDGDPGQDITLLGDADHIRHVWIAGRKMK
jgi:imidazolonepropionase-like amidohydrolase